MSKFDYDLIGKQFGYLTVLRKDENCTRKRDPKWLCSCKCGNTKSISRHALVTGHTTSCGCKAYESHNRKHGMAKTRIYGVWLHMRGRCRHSYGKDIKVYQGRNITVCDEWDKDFMSFYNWSMESGYNDDLTIDRIDNEKGYSPENCRWITNAEQQLNKRNTVKVLYNGEEIPLVELCRKLNFNYKLAHARYIRMKKKGLPIQIEKIFF